MQLGKSKLDITPNDSIQLAGFAHRKGSTQKIMQRLYIKTFVLRNNSKEILFIIADLIWWDDLFVEDLKEDIAYKFAIPEEYVCFHATHNHSGPQTSSKFSQQLGLASNSYLHFLREQILLGIEEAEENIEEVSMKIGKGVSDIGIYRRSTVGGKAKMMPNSEVAIDNELTTVSFHTKDFKTKAVWIHYTCHPTTTDENIISSEFSGMCCEQLEKRYENATFAFLQGFCGDIRPNLVEENQFYRGTADDLQEMSIQFTKDVSQAIKSNRMSSGNGSFYCNQYILPLIFSDKNVRQLVPSSLFAEWPELVHHNMEKGYNLTIQHIHISEELSFISCNAELVQDYGLYVRNLKNGLLPLGYSNGMMGYIPTTKQLREGGYEALDSIFYFGYPSTIHSEMEERIKIKFNRVLGGKK